MKNKIVTGLLSVILSYIPIQANAAEIKSVPYRHFERVEMTQKQPSSELENIVVEDNLKLGGVKGVVNYDKFYDKFMSVSDKLGYKNIEDMDAKGFISWNSAVTKFIINAYRGKSKADDVPFEELINPNHYRGEDSFTGVCRHYSQFLKEAFDATKHLNENARNIECIIVGNKRDKHVWNMYLMEGNSKIISTETDVYQTDMHEEAGQWKSGANGDRMLRSYTPGIFDKDNTRYGAGMRWQKSDFWKTHTKERIGNRYNKRNLNK